ncbi:MAG: Glucokinase [uncultured Thermomicrobiales bacterium]|uniref:Glucokinase n=1 Tax=uncultured Thermomicrobiales bacterium TaxID=1645740 RepID=A0A6J4V601_9BACT|nr:MAG: Glucokinase [uncultured Thermomicrobiales bacterium]
MRDPLVGDTNALGSETLTLAVDLGGTNVRAAAVSPGGEIVARRQLPTRVLAGLDEVLARVAEAVGAVATEAGVATTAPVGVVLPGVLNPATGFLTVAPNLGWRDLPIRDHLRERLGRPVTIGNDVNAGAFGEWRYGAGLGTRDFVYIACGTGVGGGIITDGRLLLGRAGLAGEVGHMVVTLDGPRCRCGGHGCLEAYVGGWAIEAAAQELLDGGIPSSLTDLMAERGEQLSGALINWAAEHDDGLAIEVLARAGRALGFAVASLVHLFNPEVVAIGGGVVSAGPFLLDPMREALDAQLIDGFERELRVVPAALGQDSGLLGAAALARQGS